MAALLSPGGPAVSVGTVAEARALDVSHGRRPVLRGCDFDVPAGVVGVLGRSGAGKSTLLELLVTARAPSAGELRILGRGARTRSDVRELRRRIGYLPQSFGHHPMFTVTEFVEYCGWLKQVPSAQLGQRAAAALDAVGLGDRADARLRSLSAGMLRLAGLAQAIVHQPELLVLDEPAVGLDPAQRVELAGLVRRLAETTTVVVGTESVEDVALLCSAVMVLDAGRFVFTGEVRQLEGLDRPDVPGESALERGYGGVLASAQPSGRPGAPR